MTEELEESEALDALPADDQEPADEDLVEGEVDENDDPETATDVDGPDAEEDIE